MSDTAALRSQPALPDFAQAARQSGASILAFWEGDATWRLARWVTASGSTPHWGIDGKWTPGPDPISFAEMPPLPGQENPGMVLEPVVSPMRLEHLRRIEHAAQVVVGKVMQAEKIKDAAGFSDSNMRVLYDAIIDAQG